MPCICMVRTLYVFQLICIPCNFLFCTQIYNISNCSNIFLCHAPHSGFFFVFPSVNNGSKYLVLYNWVIYQFYTYKTQETSFSSLATSIASAIAEYQMVPASYRPHFKSSNIRSFSWLPKKSDHTVIVNNKCVRFFI